MRPLQIIYQDQDIIAINKPSGVLVHKTKIASQDLVNCVDLLRNQILQPVFPIHRLDRATSGVLLFALNSKIAKQLSQLFEQRKIEKKYVAITRGYLADEGEIDRPLKKTPQHEPKEAFTHYKTLKTMELPHAVGKYKTARYSLVELKPKTGRRNQIRRHLRGVSHPIIGDTTHGDSRHNIFFKEHFKLDRLLLHAEELSFNHPIHLKKVNLSIKSPKKWLEIF